ncbi:unnamed protein product [Musa hybrid cultivar]
MGNLQEKLLAAHSPLECPQDTPIGLLPRRRIHVEDSGSPSIVNRRHKVSDNCIQSYTLRTGSIHQSSRKTTQCKLFVFIPKDHWHIVKHNVRMNRHRHVSSCQC